METQSHVVASQLRQADENNLPISTVIAARPSRGQSHFRSAPLRENRDGPQPTGTSFLSVYPRLRRRTPRASRRRGANAAIELIIALPILIIMTLAVVQFGIFLMNMELLAVASRAGAEEASQTVGLPTTDGDPVPANVLSAIDLQLVSSGMHRCGVRLEHNVGGTQVVLGDPSPGGCDCGPTDLLPAPLPPGQYVRLTVCVELSDMMPNCMANFGLDISGPSNKVQSTTTFRYELTP